VETALDAGRLAELCDWLLNTVDPRAPSSPSGAGPAAICEGITSKATGRTYTAAYLRNICNTACLAESIRLYASFILENWDDYAHP
jgi:hypothetical protein